MIGTTSTTAQANPVGGTIGFSGYTQTGRPTPPASTCPNCGYCPHCGRGGHHTYPWVPMRAYQPVWWSWEFSPIHSVTTGTA